MHVSNARPAGKIWPTGSFHFTHMNHIAPYKIVHSFQLVIPDSYTVPPCYKKKRMRDNKGLNEF